jgi:hypothetical protein
MIERDRRDVWWGYATTVMQQRARAMRLDTKSSKQDRYSLEATSARALTERCAPRVTKMSSTSP